MPKHIHRIRVISRVGAAPCGRPFSFICEGTGGYGDPPLRGLNRCRTPCLCVPPPHDNNALLILRRPVFFATKMHATRAQREPLVEIGEIRGHISFSWFVIGYSFNIHEFCVCQILKIHVHCEIVTRCSCGSVAQSIIRSCSTTVRCSPSKWKASTCIFCHELKHLTPRSTVVSWS